MKEKVVEKEKREDEVKVTKGVFSDKTIDVLQTYYGNAIRSHVGIWRERREHVGQFSTTPSPPMTILNTPAVQKVLTAGAGINMQ